MRFRLLMSIAAICAVMALGASAVPAGAGPGNIHDDFYNPAVIGANITNRLLYGNNLGATTQYCEPPTGGSSVWIRFIGHRHRDRVYLNTNGSNFDTTLGVFSGGNICNLTPIAFDDDSGSGLQSRLSFVSRAYRNYYIRVDGYQGAQGNFNLRVRRVRF